MPANSSRSLRAAKTQRPASSLGSRRRFDTARRSVSALGAAALMLLGARGGNAVTNTNSYTGGGTGTIAAPINGNFTTGFSPTLTAGGSATTILGFGGTTAYTATDDGDNPNHPERTQLHQLRCDHFGARDWWREQLVVVPGYDPDHISEQQRPCHQQPGYGDYGHYGQYVHQPVGHGSGDIHGRHQRRHQQRGRHHDYPEWRGSQQRDPGPDADRDQHLRRQLACQQLRRGQQQLLER